MASSMVAKRVLYGYFFLGTLCFLIYYISGARAVAGLLGGVLMYFLVLYALYWSFKSIGKSEPIGFLQFFIVYLYKLSIFSSIILCLGGVFVYFQNSVLPAKMPLHTISNGERTIKFQTMSHIATQDFYKKVQLEISKSKSKDFVLFYEGVQPGTKGNKAIFDAAIGIEISPELYETFSKVYGVSHQNNEDFLGIKNDKDYNVDLDINAIVELYLEKVSEEEKERYKEVKKNVSLPKFVTRNLEPEEDIQAELLKQLASLNDTQLKIVRYINKSLLNFMIKHEGLREFIISQMDISDIFTVILDDRNTHVVQEILTSQHENIFVIYGLMHFDGILEKLQTSDPQWKIEETKYSYPISSPSFPWSE